LFECLIHFFDKLGFAISWIARFFLLEFSGLFHCSVIKVLCYKKPKTLGFRAFFNALYLPSSARQHK